MAAATLLRKAPEANLGWRASSGSHASFLQTPEVAAPFFVEWLHRGGPIAALRRCDGSQGWAEGWPEALSFRAKVAACQSMKSHQRRPASGDGDVVHRRGQRAIVNAASSGAMELESTSDAGGRLPMSESTRKVLSFVNESVSALYALS